MDGRKVRVRINVAISGPPSQWHSHGQRFWTFHGSQAPSRQQNGGVLNAWMDAPCGFTALFLSYHYSPTFSHLPLLTMTAVIPKHLILFHKARRLCIILTCIYMLLVALGATPFAQAQ